MGCLPSSRKGNRMADDLDFLADVGLVRTTIWTPRGDNSVRLYSNIVKARHLIDVADDMATPEGTLLLMGNKRIHRLPPEPGTLSLHLAEARRRRIPKVKKLGTEARELIEEASIDRVTSLSPDITREESIRSAARAYAKTMLILALYDQIEDLVEKGRDK